ncbi:hypothetical protein BDQ17DRAFT_1332091 [Cyathus striatus]|nr:hypothetical protein BDQ17DRAFT_1332091 [Cyathus striatus]
MSSALQFEPIPEEFGTDICGEDHPGVVTGPNGTEMERRCGEMELRREEMELLEMERLLMEWVRREELERRLVKRARRGELISIDIRNTHMKHMFAWELSKVEVLWLELGVENVFWILEIVKTYMTASKDKFMAYLSKIFTLNPVDIKPITFTGNCGGSKTTLMSQGKLMFAVPLMAVP